MSVEKLITDNIDIWTSAVKTKSASGRGSSKKLELYGVKKLRELILELAVRGKLVPQDPNDEPASVLLGRIREERRAEAKNKKLKAIKPISDSEFPCQLPINWTFVRLEEIIQISSGKNLTAKKMDTSGKIPVYGGNGITGFHSESNVSNKTIVIGRVGFYCGSVHLTPNSAWVTDNAFITKYSHANIDESFLVWLLKATNLSENDSATAQPVISGKKVYPIVVALPPKKEQERIAVKIDQLMALCDQLEQQTEASIEAHQVLVTTLLGTLTNSADADELMQNWTRISEHFDTLFTTEESIDQLKQTILQLAVMGKLVPQDPNDEPASVLLERIAEEKAQLIKEKKIKKQKALPPIMDEEKPFELPNGWEWCRLGELGYDLGGGTPSKANPEYWEGDIPWVSPKDMKRSYIDSAIDSVTSKAVEETTVKLIPVNSLLMVVRGMILAHSFPVALTQKPVVINQDMKALVFSKMESNYVLIMMQGLKEQMVNLVDRSSHGTCKLISEKLWGVVVAIPPLNEQKKIVSVVEELFDICEQLRVRVGNSKQTQLQLADATIDKAVK
ncbi:restriction endonuclease subunit S [Photobacterium kasasachensis]|uniref:restriction endonuclease subunit S n=1 Tax=Photobacterium kasasachensis TaxID=2910240 RepID=UPI003D1520C0